MVQPWRAPLLTLNQSVNFFLRITLQEKLLYKCLTTLTMFSGHLYASRIFHTVSLLILSKSFSRSMKLMYTLVFHSIHCSMIFRSVKMWSMHPMPGLKPTCSFLKVVSIASALNLTWDDFTEDLAWYLEECYLPQVCTLCPISLLGELNDQSIAPVFRFGLGISDVIG